MTERYEGPATSSPAPTPERAGGDVLSRALIRARWTIFWDRLWPAVAGLATVSGLFLAVSWLGLWLWLPPSGRAIGLGVFFLLSAAAFAPFLLLRMFPLLLPAFTLGDIMKYSHTTSQHPTGVSQRPGRHIDKKTLRPVLMLYKHLDIINRLALDRLDQGKFVQRIGGDLIG